MQVFLWQRSDKREANNLLRKTSARNKQDLLVDLMRDRRMRVRDGAATTGELVTANVNLLQLSIASSKHACPLRV